VRCDLHDEISVEGRAVRLAVLSYATLRPYLDLHRPAGTALGRRANPVTSWGFLARHLGRSKNACDQRLYPSEALIGGFGGQMLLSGKSPHGSVVPTVE
jgi:hypothetical protein